MLVGATPQRVAIIGGVRIPFARGNGAYAQVGNQEMLVATLRAVVDRYGLARATIGRRRGRRRHEALEPMEPDARIGARLRTRRRDAGTRSATRCGTSLEAAILVGNKIALGQIDSAIAAGVDTVSDPPVVYPKRFQQLLLKSYRGKTAGRTPGPVVRITA